MSEVPIPITGPTVCATCRAPLGVEEKVGPDETVLTFFHPFLPEGVEPHVPEPVAADSIDAIGVCDFCLAPGPRWTFPAKPFMQETHEQDEVPWASPDTEWAACDDCKADIDDDNYPAVIERHLQRRYRDESRQVRALARVQITPMMRGFAANRTGPAVREY